MSYISPDPLLAELPFGPRLEQQDWSKAREVAELASGVARDSQTSALDSRRPMDLSYRYFANDMEREVVVATGSVLKH